MRKRSNHMGAAAENPVVEAASGISLPSLRCLRNVRIGENLPTQVCSCTGFLGGVDLGWEGLIVRLRLSMLRAGLAPAGGDLRERLSVARGERRSRLSSGALEIHRERFSPQVFGHA